MWYAISLVLRSSRVLAVPMEGPSCSGWGVYQNKQINKQTNKQNKGAAKNFVHLACRLIWKKKITKGKSFLFFSERILNKQTNRQINKETVTFNCVINWYTYQTKTKHNRWFINKNWIDPIRQFVIWTAIKTSSHAQVSDWFSIHV